MVLLLVLTEGDRTKAFSEYHASKSGCHQGRDRTEDKLRHYYWPHMHLDIYTSLGKCTHAYIYHQYITRTVYNYACMYTVHLHALLVVCVIYVPRAPWPVLNVQCFGCVGCVLYPNCHFACYYIYNKYIKTFSMRKLVVYRI